MKPFVENYNSEVDRFRRTEVKTSIHEFVNYDRVKWDSTLKNHIQRLRYGSHENGYYRESLYRPFTKKRLYFDRLFINSVHLQHYFFPVTNSETENRAICVSGAGHDVFRTLITDKISEFKFSNSANGGTQCFPFYTYDQDGSNRRENITDYALDQFRSHYNDPAISKWDIFYYVYRLLHHPGYRERYALDLKRNLPRIPFAPNPHPKPLPDGSVSTRPHKEGGLQPLMRSGIYHPNLNAKCNWSRVNFARIRHLLKSVFGWRSENDNSMGVNSAVRLR